MTIRSFKGIKSFEYEFDGQNATIKGANGTGKTSVYDAFMYLLFGKDSTGRKEFELRPLDDNNQPIKGLTLTVEAQIRVDGVNHLLRKSHIEKVVKGELKGYETACWIDEVPKKVGEYGDYTKELIPEDVFKLLTDLHYFNGKMKWNDRRATLLDIAGEIAGEIGSPEGFDELLAALNGRTIDEYKKVLAEQKKRLTKEQDEINPRIDEIQRGLDEYVGSADSGLEKKREIIKGDILLLDNKRGQLFKSEQERQQKISQINTLKGEKAARETELKNDTSGVQKWVDEKAKLLAGIAARKSAVASAQSAIELHRSRIATCRNMLESHTASLNTIRDEYAKADTAPHDLTCYACGQKLPADKLAGNEKQRNARLAEIAERGNKIKADVDSAKKEMGLFDDELKELREVLEKAKIELKEATDYEAANIEGLNSSIANNETIPPEQDDNWQNICDKIAKVEAEIGEPVSEQLQAIDTDRAIKTEELVGIDKALAHADTIKKNRTRIKELESDEKRIGQQLADIEKQLNNIDQYKADESRLIESSVNGMFKHTEFKLFKQLLNGATEDCCEATLNGVPYPDMSYGQKILVGIDIINVLSAHYGLSVPIWIDNSESLTYPVEFAGQTIQLCALKSARELTIKTKGELANV